MYKYSYILFLIFFLTCETGCGLLDPFGVQLTPSHTSPQPKPKIKKTLSLNLKLDKLKLQTKPTIHNIQLVVADFSSTYDSKQVLDGDFFTFKLIDDKNNENPHEYLINIVLDMDKLKQAGYVVKDKPGRWVLRYLFNFKEDNTVVQTKSYGFEARGYIANVPTEPKAPIGTLNWQEIKSLKEYFYAIFLPLDFFD